MYTILLNIIITLRNIQLIYNWKQYHGYLQKQKWKYMYIKRQYKTRFTYTDPMLMKDSPYLTQHNHAKHNDFPIMFYTKLNILH